jgi:hypothetical protein
VIPPAWLPVATLAVGAAFATAERTASVIVTDPNGGFLSLIDCHEDAATALSKLRRATRISSASAFQATGLVPEDS